MIYCRIGNTTDTPDNCVVAIARTTTLNCITEQSEFYIECRDYQGQGNTSNGDPNVNTVTGDNDGDTGNSDSGSPDRDNITLNVLNATMTDGEKDCEITCHNDLTFYHIPNLVILTW